MGKQVLYIEDDDRNRLLVERVLLAEDYDVSSASNAPDGINMALSNVPDIILLDINMPGYDGYMAISEMRQHPSLDRVPIIALTANVMKGDREGIMAHGFDGYISKPIDVDRLPTEIEFYMQQGPLHTGK